MQLISNKKTTSTNKRQPTPFWVPVIKKEFGDFGGFAGKFRPSFEVQNFCALNTRRAIAMGDSMPSLRRAVVAYGRRQIAQLLNSHLVAVVTSLGEHEKLNSSDMLAVANAIIDNHKFSSLKFSSVLGFFHSLRIGVHKIFGEVSPRKILEVYNSYASEAMEKEYKERLSLEKEQEAREYEASVRKAVSWPERARRLGLPEGTTFQQYLMKPISQTE